MSSKSKTTSTTTANPTTTAAFNPVWNNASSQINQGYKPYTGEVAPGLQPLQSQGMGLAQQNVGMGQGTVNGAIGATQGLLGYQPQQVGTGPVSADAINHYMDPYMGSVVGSALSDIDLQRQRALNDQSGQFTQAGAWGGSRQGVSDALTNEAYGRLGAQTASGLLSQGYGQALSAAQQDQGLGLQAGMANQQAGLAGVGLGYQGAGLLGQLGGQQQQMGTQDLSNLLGAGGVGQATQGAIDAGNLGLYQNAQQYPFMQAAANTGLLGTLPAMYAGAATQGTQKTSNPAGTIGSILQGAGSIAQGAAMFSDARLKTDVSRIGALKGHPLYRFRYVWDEPGTMREGVMAQDLGDHPAVSRHASGFLMVDYGAL